jgi:hypothetical protein
MAVTKAAKRAPIELGEWRSAHLPGVPHKVLRNWALKAFVDARISTPRTFKQLAAECAERFGKNIAPSKSSLHRYWEAFHRPHAPALHRPKRRRVPRKTPNRKEAP